MNFSFYRADPDYCDFLRKSDCRVPYTRDDKITRPFVGIVISVHGLNYYAPLTSPKPKHLNMKNQIDFLKINGGLWGAVNFNNMIPIHSNNLQKVDMKILPTDIPETKAYKNLLSNQLSWCNSNGAAILKQAEKLYNTITQKRGWAELINRCCDFSIDETQYLIYCREHGFTAEP